MPNKQGNSYLARSSCHHNLSRLISLFLLGYLLSTVTPLKADLSDISDFDEQLRWKASPTATYEWFDTYNEAVLDFQSKSSYYAQLTEEIPILEYFENNIRIKYKIPNTEVNISPWDYYYVNNNYGCPHHSTEGGAIDCYFANKVAYLQGPNVAFEVCGPVLEIDRNSGAWEGTAINTLGSILGLYTTERRDYDMTQYVAGISGQCNIITESLLRLGRRRTITCDYPTTLYDPVPDQCVSNSRATVYAYAKYFATAEPLICYTKDTVQVGNPCNPADGNKIQTETDYVNSKGTLRVKRHYATQGVGDGYHNMGPRWRHNYSQRLNGYRMPKYEEYQGKKTPLYTSPRDACIQGWGSIKSEVYGGLLANATATYRSGACEILKNGAYVAKLPIHNTLYGRKDVGTSIGIQSISRGNGQALTFRYISGQWQPLHPNGTTLISSGANWIFVDANGTREEYSDNPIIGIGKLLSRTTSTGQVTHFTYDNEGRLSTVTGHYGETLTYHYNEEGYLVTITTPDGNLNYAYDGLKRLSQVTYPDNTQRQYHYEDVNFSHYLTGIADENNQRYATWAYDSDGRAILSEHADGAEQVTFTYHPNGSTTITDATGAERTYYFQIVQGTMKISHVEGDRCTTCPNGGIKAYTYDSNGFIASKTDWNSNVTSYIRDAQGRELSRTEAVGTPEARTITTTWDTVINKPLIITEPERVTEFAYDSNGRLLSQQQHE
ncbi:MAG: DUF6531 domain-containing protein [Candidatus Thiodiazotropha endolucinida]